MIAKLRQNAGLWRCHRGYHRWGYHALKDWDLCQRTLCGRVWPREDSYEFVSPSEVFAAESELEASVG